MLTTPRGVIDPAEEFSAAMLYPIVLSISFRNSSLA